MLQKSQALTKSRSKLKILNLNRLLLSGKNRNYRKNKRHWISSDRISLHCLMLLRSVQTYFQQNGNLFLSQEINKIALATHSFSSKSSHDFKPISSQVTPYGAPPEVFVFGLCQLYNETKDRDFPIFSYYLWTFLLQILNMAKDIPIKESHIITFVSSPVYIWSATAFITRWFF